MKRARLKALAALGMVACLGSARMAAAQTGNSTIKGIIVAADPRRPLEGARIFLVGTEYAATTDARGTFEFGRLEAGQYVIQASAIGFTALSSPLLLKERETLEVEFVAQSEAANLPDLVVSESANNGPADWLRRKAEGNGRYITRATIESRRVSTVPDALRMVPGVRIECRGAVCVARMSRAPRGCSPGYFLDGVPSDPAVLWLTPVSDIDWSKRSLSRSSWACPRTNENSRKFLSVSRAHSS